MNKLHSVYVSGVARMWMGGFPPSFLKKFVQTKKLFKTKAFTLRIFGINPKNPRKSQISYKNPKNPKKSQKSQTNFCEQKV